MASNKVLVLNAYLSEFSYIYKTFFLPTIDCKLCTIVHCDFDPNYYFIGDTYLSNP